MASRSSSRARRKKRRIAIAVGVSALAVGLIAAGSVVAVGLTASEPSAAVPAASTKTATPTPTPLTAAESLLQEANDPAACAVSFVGDSVPDEPMLQTQDALFSYLPIPDREGDVFAGWYPTEADAAAHNIAARVNGSDVVACTDDELTLYGGWVTPDEVTAENTGVPILMYHQFTTRPEGEDGWLRGNYAYIGDFEEQITYIADTGFYLPTWDELSAFIDGRLFLPNRSVIITDDDADSSWLELAAPVVDSHGVLTTSFVITKFRSEGTPSKYVLQRSHTHDMHEAGANGDGRMVNYTAEEIAADMQTSADVLGAKEIMAYPFGHYNDTAKEGLRRAGFEMARTIEQGYVHVGTDKLALPCIRMNYGMGLNELISLIG
ncbi:hypothetical protein FHX48_002015 [Microbacterium halimionae]|uniref:NodB homology domain-containing protein n=1 Tax=Microbacterium halimionae TaxID=1526413 RepID=A0A7W3JQ40_9MICO|nr:polysaccharide deacetylase family protein [Microbacterium halimionae]MBA8816921.1 hypothetical protein [Microbacterium halimionae]NII94540.1 hypothetical protein [Microbacterium halimionae]